MRRSRLGLLRRRTRAVLFAFSFSGVALVAALHASCQNVLDINGPVTLSTDACGLHTEPGDCRSCVESNCCVEATACARDIGCGPLEGCLLGCGSDYACRASCSEAHWAVGGNFVPVLDTCIAQHCNDACGLVCGMASAFTPPDAAPACETCLAKSCGATITCATNLDCQLAGHCVGDCATPDCRVACLDSDAGQLFATQALASALHCIGPCQIGKLWQCAGKVAWPLAPTGAMQVTLTVTNAIGGAPLGGVAVQACPAAGSDTQCTNPVANGTTNRAGQVTLQLPPVLSSNYGFQGYFELVLPAPSQAHYLYFLSFPLSVSNAPLSLGIYTDPELQSLLAVPGYTADPTRGVLWISASDCLSIPAPNVTFRSTGFDAKTQTVFLRLGGGLDPTLTETDPSGTAFFLNTPATKLTVLAYPDALGGASSSTLNVFVRPGTISYVQAIPTQF
jgi:hypothetical protein